MGVWQRFLADFWPPDNSRVAPNIVAAGICFVAGYLFKGRQIIRQLHAKLDEQHRQQMDAHRVTHDAVTGPE